MSVFARSLGNVKVEIDAGGHALLADEPIAAGGTEAGPNPYDFLLAALASCKVITMQMYAQRKGWPLESVEVSLSTHKIHAKDCEDCESDPDARVDIIETEIKLFGNLDQEQRERILAISEKCPVHRTLTSETKIRTKLID